MKILVLAPHPFFQPRGTPIAVRQLLEFLSGEGHEVDVLTYHEGTDIDIPHCAVYRIPALPGIHGIRPGFSLKKVCCDAVMFAKSLRMVRRNHYDLVHAVEESVFMAAVIRRLFGIPFIYDMDSALAEQMIEKHARLEPFRRRMQAAEGQVVRGSLGVLAVCPALVSRVQNFDRTKLVACVEDASLLGAVPPGIEVLRGALGAADPLVMYVGNLERYQGVDLLLESFATALAELPAARLVVVGGAPRDVAAYRRKAADSGLADRVHFIGPRPLEMLRGYLQQADILVSPRLMGNNTPMKIYSYLDSGVPILATRLPTHTQVLDDSIACLASASPEMFGAALVRLAQDPAYRKRLGQNARERVQLNFTPEATRGKLRRFYQAVSSELALSRQ
ncbi:MAG: glycosyltransferase family 4 protein [Gemmatimonadota bacterium]